MLLSLSIAINLQYVFYFCSQTATLYWEMRRFRRSIRSSIAPMDSASWQDSRERKSCRRVALASFSMGRKRRRKKRPWSTRASRARRNWKWRLSSTKRTVSSTPRYPMTGMFLSREWSRREYYAQRRKRLPSFPSRGIIHILRCASSIPRVSGKLQSFAVRLLLPNFAHLNCTP